MVEVKDVCKAVQGVPKGDSCEFDSNSKVFANCNSIGGAVKNGKCVISIQRLKEITNGK